MEEGAGMQWILKGKHIGDRGEPIGNCRFKAGDFRDKKGRQRIDSVPILSVSSRL